jgi:pilus assembly protein CpaE
MPSARSEAGQSAVELVALLPLVALVGVALAQAALAGQAAWLAGSAADAAARAHAIGSDPERAARRALPGHLERGLRVRTTDDGEAAVRVRLPAITGIALGHTEARARMEPQR